MDTKQMVEGAGIAVLSGLIMEAQKKLPEEQVRQLVLFSVKFGKNHQYFQEAIAQGEPVDTTDWGADL